MADTDTSVMRRVMRAIGRRNSVYCAVLVVGAFVGEHYTNKVFDSIWLKHNRGKLYEDIPTLGSRVG